MLTGCHLPITYLQEWWKQSDEAWHSPNPSPAHCMHAPFSVKALSSGGPGEATTARLSFSGLYRDQTAGWEGTITQQGPLRHAENHAVLSGWTDVPAMTLWAWAEGIGGEGSGRGWMGLCMTFFQWKVKTGIGYLLDRRQSLTLPVDCVQCLDVHLNNICRHIYTNEAPYNACKLLNQRLVSEGPYLVS